MVSTLDLWFFFISLFTPFVWDVFTASHWAGNISPSPPTLPVSFIVQFFFSIVFEPADCTSLAWLCKRVESNGRYGTEKSISCSDLIDNDKNNKKIKKTKRGLGATKPVPSIPAGATRLAVVLLARPMDALLLISRPSLNKVRMVSRLYHGYLAARPLQHYSYITLKKNKKKTNMLI